MSRNAFSIRGMRLQPERSWKQEMSNADRSNADSYGRGQVEWALWRFFLQGRQVGPEQQKVFRTRIKRLLELDREKISGRGPKHRMHHLRSPMRRRRVRAPTSTSSPSTHSAWPWRSTSWTPASRSPRSCSCSGTFVTTWKPGLRGFFDRRRWGAGGSGRKIGPRRPF